MVGTSPGALATPWEPGRTVGARHPSNEATALGRHECRREGPRQPSGPPGDGIEERLLPRRNLVGYKSVERRHSHGLGGPPVEVVRTQVSRRLVSGVRSPVREL